MFDSLVSRFPIIAVSGIFSSKYEDIDILPPPPPFPKIKSKTEDAKATEKAAKEEQRRRKEEEKALKLQEKDRLRVKDQQRKGRKEKLFNLLHGAGLVKTEEEKAQIRKEKENYRNFKLQGKKKREETWIKAEQERIEQKALEKPGKEKASERLQKEKGGQKPADQMANEKERLRLEKLEKHEQEKNGKRERRGLDLSKIQTLKIPEKKQLSIKEQFSGLFPKIGFGSKEDAPEQYPIITKEWGISIPTTRTKKIKGIPTQNFPEVRELNSKQKTGFKNFPASSLSKKKGKQLEEELKDLDTFNEGRIKTGKSLELKDDWAENTNEIIVAEKEIQDAVDGLKADVKRPFLSRIFTKKKKIETDAGAEPQVEMPHIMPRTYDKIDFVEMAEAKIHKARMALMDFNFEDAKRIYIEVMGLYNKMELKDKHDVYEDIKDLYYERKNAEKFAKKSNDILKKF